MKMKAPLMHAVFHCLVDLHLHLFLSLTQKILRVSMSYHLPTHLLYSSPIASLWFLHYARYFLLNQGLTLTLPLPMVLPSSLI
jgi:hypothetical protein